VKYKSVVVDQKKQKLGLLDEHQRSKQFYGCKRQEAILEKFKRIEYHNQKGDLKTKLIHGLPGESQAYACCGISHKK
jgi:hypothetical protein